MNWESAGAQDRLLTFRFSGLSPGRKRLRLFRIDAARRWTDDLELRPVEDRTVETFEEFRCQALAPADSVCMVTLSEAGSDLAGP